MLTTPRRKNVSCYEMFTTASDLYRYSDRPKQHNEELNDLYSSPNTVRVIKSRRMRWARHAARMGERRGVYRVLVGKTEGKTQGETQA